MDIIQDILSESEVLDMPMETLSAFVRLFNVNMNQKVEEYMSMPDANPGCGGETQHVCWRFRYRIHLSFKSKR